LGFCGVFGLVGFFDEFFFFDVGIFALAHMGQGQALLAGQIDTSITYQLKCLEKMVEKSF